MRANFPNPMQFQQIGLGPRRDGRTGQNHQRISKTHSALREQPRFNFGNHAIRIVNQRNLTGFNAPAQAQPPTYPLTLMPLLDFNSPPTTTSHTTSER